MSEETAPEPGIDFKALAAPFDPSAIHWRLGYVKPDGTEGIALAYLDARDVMDRLDEVCGPDGWQCSYKGVEGRVVCTLSIRVGTEWISKEDGAGDTAIEGEKGGISDALKRTGVCWGIGRYLYRLVDNWVQVRNKKIAPQEFARLAKILAGEKTAPPKPTDPPAAPQVHETRNGKCMRLAKQRIADHNLSQVTTDKEKWAEARELCSELARGMGFESGHDWTHDSFDALEKAIAAYHPLDDAGLGFDSDPKLNLAAVHQHARERVPNRDPHDIAHEAAGKLGFASLSEYPGSGMSELKRAIDAIAIELGTWQEPGQ